jgi:hypothetical protein
LWYGHACDEICCSGTFDFCEMEMIVMRFVPKHLIFVRWKWLWWVLFRII